MSTVGPIEKQMQARIAAVQARQGETCAFKPG